MAIIRFPRDDEEQLVSDLFAELWGQNHIFVRDKNLFRWQFDASQLPFAVDTPLSILVAEEQGRLEALQCLIGVNVVLSGKVAPGVWLTNLHKRANATSPGIGIQIMLGVQKLPVEFIAASSVRDSVLPIYKSLRYSCYDHIDRWIKVIDPDRAAGLLRKSVSIDKYCMSKSQRTSGGAFEVEKVNFADVENVWDRFWIANWRPIINGIDRTFSYISWRYAKNPCLDYRMLVVRKENSGELLGALIYRVEEVRDSSIKLIRMIEFWPTTEGVGAALLSSIVEIAQANHTAVIDHFVSNGPAMDSLGAAGFFRDGIDDNALFASRFQPLDFTIPTFNVVFRSNEFFQKKMEFPMTFLKSDGDQDRPN